MIIPSELIQITTGTIGSLCFGILFNMHGKKLVFSVIGGFIATGLFILTSHFVTSEPFVYFIVAAVISLYSEIMARVLKTPATPIITTALVPLIPGGSLYHTMAYAFNSSWSEFWEKGVYTLKLASSLALGIILITAAVQLTLKPFSHKKIQAHE